MKELTPLFKALRKMGLDARQRFMCCTGCAGAAVANEYREKLLKDPTFSRKGFVYNTAQDVWTERDMERAERRGEQVEVPIRYGPVEATGDGFDFNGPAVKPLATVGLSCKEVGALVVKACEQVGMEYIWDGDPNKVIYVLPFGRKPEKAKRFA